MNLKLRTLIFFIIGACLCVSCQDFFAPPKNIDIDSEEYAVYNAVLESWYELSTVSQVLLIDHTRVNSDELLEFDLASFQETTPLDGELINSFKERNKEPYPLKPDLDFGLDYQLLTQEEVDKLYPQDKASGWELFWEIYPEASGFIYLSRVGFSANFKNALVYMAQYRYDQPIHGGYYLLIKKQGGWEIINGYEWMT